MNNYAFDYNASDLKTTIYGQTSGQTLAPIWVDSTGAVVVTGTVNSIISGHTTANSAITGLTAGAAYTIWPAGGLNISQDTMVSFAVLPTYSDINVKIQVSPNGTTWTDDTVATVVPSGTMIIQTPKHYMQYAALAYEANVTTATLNAWYQVQN